MANLSIRSAFALAFGCSVAGCITPTIVEPPPVASPADAVRVSIDTDNPNVALERRAYYDDHWEAICFAPCGVTIDRATTLRIRGHGVVPSERFSLAATGATADAVTLHVEAGAQANRALGWTLFGLSAIGAFYVDTRGVGLERQGSAPPTGVAFAAAIALESVAMFGAIYLASPHTSVTWNDRPMAEPTAPIGGGLALTPRGLVF